MENRIISIVLWLVVIALILVIAFCDILWLRIMCVVIDFLLVVAIGNLEYHLRQNKKDGD